jgi:hypothetical protein
MTPIDHSLRAKIRVVFNDSNATAIKIYEIVTRIGPTQGCPLARKFGTGNNPRFDLAT